MTYDELRKEKGCGALLGEEPYYRMFQFDKGPELHNAWGRGAPPLYLHCGGSEAKDGAIRLCRRCMQKVGLLW